MMLPHFRRILQSSDLFADALRSRSIPKKKIVIDFSSPNIAKTFHVGNLRSTLYGNFIQKMNRCAGHDVHSINYLGDWGKQFSIMALHWKINFQKQDSSFFEKWENEMSTCQKVDYLTKLYADANRIIKLDAAYNKRADQLFADMEESILRQNNFFPSSNNKNNEPEVMALWREWRQLSIKYLQEFYARFCVSHNEWSCESNYVTNAHRLTEKLIHSEVAFFTADKLWAIRDKFISGKVVIRKSNNSSLYLSRDLAAIFDRKRLFNADEYLYVVDRSQYTHFSHLKSLVEALGDAELAEKIIHVHYGRIIGLSTRDGKNDSVDYLVKEGVSEAKRFVLASPTTRLTENSAELEDSTAKLAQSAIVFDLMRRHRSTEYTFSFRGAFKVDNNNALLLNEKYSRLCSMEKVNFELMARVRELTLNDSVSLGRLNLEMSGTAQNLSRLLYEFDTIVFSSYTQMEPCLLTNFLLKLSVQLGKSLADLHVRGEVEAKALPRLLLFMATKRVLHDGMKMLGIKPLEQL